MFLNLHSRIGGYDPSRPALPWTFSVVRSTWLDWLRKESRQRARSDAWATERTHLGEDVTTGERVDERLAGAEAAATLEAALSRLPVASRALVERRVVGEVPYETIAKETGKSPVALRKSMERALGTLRAHVLGKGKKT